MRDADVKKLLNIGALLSAERDLNRLLERILDCVMDLANCDAGTPFQSLVRVLSSAVDERTPYNGSHTRHMAACGG